MRTSGQTLQTQITRNDSDISTLTSNLGTTGQTLQTKVTSIDSDIASHTTNLGTTGQTLQTQITSNDSDISTLYSTIGPIGPPDAADENHSLPLLSCLCAEDKNYTSNLLITYIPFQSHIITYDVYIIILSTFLHTSSHS